MGDPSREWSGLDDDVQTGTRNALLGVGSETPDAFLRERVETGIGDYPVEIYAGYYEPLLVWLTVEDEPYAADRDVLDRLVLLPQRDVPAFDGTLVFPLHVVE